MRLSLLPAGLQRVLQEKIHELAYYVKVLRRSASMDREGQDGSVFLHASLSTAMIREGFRCSAHALLGVQVPPEWEP